MDTLPPCLIPRALIVSGTYKTGFVVEMQVDLLPSASVVKEQKEGSGFHRLLLS